MSDLPDERGKDLGRGRRRNTPVELAKTAVELARSSEELREETSNQVRRATREFRILFAVITVILLLLTALTWESFQQGLENTEILQTVQDIQAFQVTGAALPEGSKIGLFQDLFAGADADPNPAFWENVDNLIFVEQGVLHIPCQDDSANEMESEFTYDLQGSSVTAEISEVPTADGTNALFEVIDPLPEEYVFGWRILGGTLEARIGFNRAVTGEPVPVVASVPYDAEEHHFLRLGLDDDLQVANFDVSADSQTWETLHQEDVSAADVNWTSMRLELECGGSTEPGDFQIRAINPNAGPPPAPQPDG